MEHSGIGFHFVVNTEVFLTLLQMSPFAGRTRNPGAPRIIAKGCLQTLSTPFRFLTEEFHARGTRRSD